MPSKKTHTIVPIQQAAQPAVQPKLTKTELIQALALRMKQQEEEHNAPIDKKIDAIQKRMKEEVLNACREHLKQITETNTLLESQVEYCRYKGAFRIDITAKTTPRYEALRKEKSALAKELRVVHQIEEYTKAARAQLTQKMDRVPELMKNKDFVKGLDTTLKALKAS